MCTHLDRCGAMRRGRRPPITAALLVALTALLIAIPSTSALAQSATPNTAAMKSAVVEVPNGDLPEVIAGLPVSQLGLSNAEVGALLGTLDSGVLGGKAGVLTTLVGTLLSGNPQATVGELTEEVQEDPALRLLLTLAGKTIDPEQVVAGLSTEQLSTLLNNFTASAQATQIEHVLASLAGGEGVSGANAAALQSIIADLVGVLGPEGLTKLREDLGSLPTGLSSEQLSGLSPQGLAETITQLFATATPTQLQPVLSDLLGNISWGAGTTGSLAQTLSVPLETLAGVLGESSGGTFSTLPVVLGEVGSTGNDLGLVHVARGLVVGLLGPEEAEETKGGEGSGGSGGNGGEGSSGSSGAGGNGGAGGGSNAGSNGAGGSGAGDGTTASGLTVEVTLPSSAPASTAAGSRSVTSKPTTRLKLLSWRRHGRVVTVVLLAPAAGTLKLSGRGVRSTSVHLRAGGRVTLTATLSKARTASLRRKHRQLKVRLKATFKPSIGASSSTAVTVPFA